MDIVVMWITILSFALSSSIDNFGVGISYGITGIRVGFISNLVISLIAFIFSEIGIYSGQLLSKLIPGMLSKVIGALILFIIGIRILFITLRTKKARLEQNKKTAPYAIGDILHSPESADLDHSGSIGLWEAIVLGVAVSLNALTNGLSAGLMKFSPFGISMATAVFSYLAIWLGCHLGSKVATIRIGPWNMGQFSNVISAVLLLLIGLHTLL